MKLVDNKFGHGARFEGVKKHAKRHKTRNFAGQGSSPFDWTKPLIRNYTQPIKNQFGASMCGGELLSQFMQIYRVLALGLPFQELSEISIYSKKYVTGGGMYLTDLANCARFEGATAFAKVPTPANCTEQQAESTNWETPALLQDCLAKALVDIQSVNINIDSIAQAIRDNYAVGFLIGGTNNNQWSSAYPVPPLVGSQPQWYHFLCSTPNVVPMITPTELQGLKDGIITIQDLKQKYGF